MKAPVFYQYVRMNVDVRGNTRQQQALWTVYKTDFWHTSEYRDMCKQMFCYETPWVQRTKIICGLSDLQKNAGRWQ